jgi:hypothetical protein
MHSAFSAEIRRQTPDDRGLTVSERLSAGPGLTLLLLASHHIDAMMTTRPTVQTFQTLP